MKIVNVSQGSAAWLKWRQQGITATDAVVLLGLSPYKSVWRLWAEKVGFAREADLSLNPLVRKGRQNEAKARQAVEAKLNDILLPVCVESSLNPLMRASLDGLTSQREPVELKCPSEAVWREIVEHGTQSRAYRMYRGQVQHQLLVTQAEKGYLVFWHPHEGIRLFEITPDIDLLKRLVHAAAPFWTQVENRIEPEKDLNVDLFIPEGLEAKAWISSAKEYRRLESEIAQLKRRMQELTDQQQSHLEAMKSYMGDFRYADYAGVMVTRYRAKGRVNYQKLLADRGITVDKQDEDYYREPSSERTRVTVTESLAPRNIIDADALAPLNEEPKGLASYQW